MKYHQRDVKRVSRKSEIVKGQVARHFIDVLQHVPTGITCLGQGNYRDSYYNALELLEKTVNAYYAAVEPTVTDEMCAALQLEMPVEGCSTGECGCPYRVSLDTRKRMGEPQPFGGVEAHIIAFDEAPTLADMLDKGWINRYYGKMGSRYTELYSELISTRHLYKQMFEAECWLNEQPDHTTISKGLVPAPSGPVWELIERHVIAESHTGKLCVDFDALRRDICKQYNVTPY